MTLERPVNGHVEPLGTVGTDVYVVTRLVPRGPSGLWRSLAAAAGTSSGPEESTGSRSVAHLGYLASLS